MSSDSIVSNFTRNHKLETSTAPTKVKSVELAYSQAPNWNQIDRQWIIIQRVRLSDSQTAVVDGV